MSPKWENGAEEYGCKGATLSAYIQRRLGIGSKAREKTLLLHFIESRTVGRERETQIPHKNLCMVARDLCFVAILTLSQKYYSLPWKIMGGGR